MDDNLKWISKGNTGCNFASVFAKNPESIGWVRIINPITFTIPEGASLLSMIFIGKTKKEVHQWALDNGFYNEKIADDLTGLRIKLGNTISWVQYFGPDSHVSTRRTPHYELLLCVKMPAKYYFKVGFNGILHLAHASIEHIKETVIDKMWETSTKRTFKLLGYKPGIKEAAKTTFKL